MSPAVARIGSRPTLRHARPALARRAERALAAASLAVLLGGCGGDSPTAPTTFRISGRVVLTAQLTAPDGHFTGTRTISDADGVRVELLADHGAIASTATAGGRYTFTNVPRGAYRLRARLGAELSDVTTDVTAVDRDIEVGDVLHLDPFGDIYPVPNPFASTLLGYFDVARRTPGDIRVYDLGGRVVRQLYSGPLEPGLQQLFWDGRDADGTPAAHGAYWLTLRDDDGLRAQLVLRE